MKSNFLSKLSKFKFKKILEPIDKNTRENPQEELGILTTFPPSKTIKELEKEIKFPIVIIGTRKPHQKWFWAWDFSFSMLIRQCLNPYLYLTFQDKEGKIIGPIRYHSELIGWGLKAELSLRSQLGRLSGFENSDLYEIPKKIEVTGGEGSIGIGVGNSYTRLRFPGIGSDILLQYVGVCSLGGFGYLKIKSGTFEAEETTCQYGMQPWCENYFGKWFVLCAFLVSSIPYIVQIAALTGVMAV